MLLLLLLLQPLLFLLLLVVLLLSFLFSAINANAQLKLIVSQSGSHNANATPAASNAANARGWTREWRRGGRRAGSSTASKPRTCLKCVFIFNFSVASSTESNEACAAVPAAVAAAAVVVAAGVAHTCGAMWTCDIICLSWVISASDCVSPHTRLLDFPYTQGIVECFSCAVAFATHSTVFGRLFKVNNIKALRYLLNNSTFWLAFNWISNTIYKIMYCVNYLHFLKA